ncbi:MAG TPA: glycosyl hydrolase 115 family protein, partial [Phycisphaerae bacterium]
ANFCWPAMHDVTKAFNIYPENKEVADRYGIVMGSSHCEPMLRNNVTEWGQANAASYNYVTNRTGVLDYWRKRLEENGKYENVYTIGMRGIHDGDMTGGGTVAQKVTRLNQIITDERDLISQEINKDVTKVPQIYCPYKEVLTYYQNGAVPPDDVTLVWADDNHGYIRQLSTPAEQKRSGGAGVYYHISYWGVPHDYLWLTTTPPALIWEELSKAYDYGARNLWVINVGDLKPGEIDLTMAMSVAYDAKRYTLDNVDDYLKDFATRTFGSAYAAEIAGILKEYYHLNYQRKPEHLGFNASQSNPRAVQPTEFSDAEITQRLAAFNALVRRADTVNGKLPKQQLDAFYELVLYPVRCSALQNVKMLQMDMNRRDAARGDAAAAIAAADQSKSAYDQIQTETAYFNDTLAGGKWKYMMSAAPHATDVFKAPVFVTVGPTAAGAVPASEVRIQAPARAAVPAGTFADEGGYISIAAEHFSRKVDQGGAGWKVIAGLGREGDSVAVYPTTTPSITDISKLPASAPALEYDIDAGPGASTAKITLQAIPTHRINPERG